MKSTMKKILAVALVLMMALPLVAFPISADDAEATPLYTVNFDGDDNMSKLVEGWNGSMTITPNGASVDLKVRSGKWSNASAQLNGLNIQNGSYTFVFTVTASDADEEVGFVPDHQTGFVVNPGQNTFRYTDHLNGTTPIETTEYDGTGELTQTYAIEIAGEGEGTTDRNGTPQPNIDITHYKLYNVTKDASGAYVWNLVCDLADHDLPNFFFDWGYKGDCDANVYARFSRDRVNYKDANNGTITISDFSVYEGLVAEKIHIHNFAFAETITAPTCTEKGLDLWTCACGEEEERDVAALGHNYEEVVTTEPTVETEGVLTKTCGRCGDVITESIVKAEAETPITDEPLYEMNFNGTEGVFGSIDNSVYDGMGTKKVTNGGRNIELKIGAGQIPSVGGSVWSGQMFGNDAMLGKSYTVVFTVDAPDYQSVGIFFKWRDGFFINPMNNTYSVGQCANPQNGGVANVEKYVATTEYDGSGKAVQTYAVEFASGSEANADGKYECTAYNLYVLKDGEWMLICALDEETREAIAWNETDFEFMVQLARVSEDVTPDGSEENVYTNTGSVIVSYMKVYEGNDVIHIHDYKLSETVDFTCTTEGYEIWSCDCGAEKHENVKPASGHNYGAFVVTKPATCTEDGLQKRECVNCHDKESEVVPAAGHNYDDGVVTDPTCSEDGYKTKTCTVCGDTKKEAGESAKGHNYGAWETTKAATCTEEGSKKQTCVDCDDVVTEVIPATGKHTYGEWVVEKDATCAEEGLKEKTCTVCGGEKITEVISKIPHSYNTETIIKEANCTDTGLKELKCACGDTKTEDIPALGHDSDEKETIKAATCTEPGEEAIGVCSRCGVSAGTQPIPALGHEYNEEITKDATCTEAGSKTSTCTRCGDTETEAIDATGHSYGEWVVTDPTCTVDGYKTQTCANCSDVKTEAGAAATGHNYGAWGIINPATCTEDGLETRVCADCYGNEEKVIKAKGHNYGAFVVTEDATCTEDGIKEKKCGCGDTITETIPATGHNYGSWEVMEPNSCTEDGTKTQTCANCNDVKSETIPKLGHSYGEFVETQAPTCTEDGVKTKACVTCGDTITEVIPATGHSYGEWVVTAPTCTEAGYKTKTCANCGDVVTEAGAAATGHTIGEWTETKAPTCTEAGSKEKVCTACGGEKVTETIPATGHSYGEWVETKAPTANEEGTKEKTCTACGDKVTEAIAKLPASNDDDGSNSADDPFDDGYTPETKAPETETKAPETTPETEPTSNKGCFGSISMSGVALIGTCAAMLALKRRKNEDD